MEELIEKLNSNISYHKSQHNHANQLLSMYSTNNKENTSCNAMSPAFSGENTYDHK
jgi:hypothetical protein